MNSKKVAEFNQDSGFELPGGNGQLKHLFEQNISKEKHTLIIGPATNAIVKRLLGHFSEINIIADNYDSLINIRMKLKEHNVLKIKMMDFAHTDFKDAHFNLVYSQGSISVPDRKNILKEIKRIISKDGIVSVGEVFSLKEPVPAFVKDIWERSGLEPMASSAINEFYETKGFKIISEQDLSKSLKDYYIKTMIAVSKVNKNEKKQNKKYYSHLKHESNIYLKLGGDKYIGFKSLIMRKLN
jgi:ubiquinone/menaquinone biosynthesis C-methylase UbiE